MSFAAVASGVGAALGGLGGLIGGIGAGNRAKKIIKAQEKSQKNLMDYQNSIDRENLELDRRYNEDWTDRYFNKYESLSARRSDAEAAGLSPEAALGMSSGAGSATSGDSTGGVSIPGAPDVEKPRTAQEIVAGLGEAMSGIAQIEELRDADKSRKLDLQNQENSNEAQILQLEKDRYELGIVKNAFDRIKANNEWEDWTRNRDREAYDRQVKREDFLFNEQKVEAQRRAEKHGWDRQNAIDSREQARLQRLLLNGQITEQNWANQYRKTYNRNPASSYTFADFLYQIMFGQPENTPNITLGENIVKTGESLFNSLTSGLSELVSPLGKAWSKYYIHRMNKKRYANKSK